MHLKEIQKIQEEFINSRKWNRFSATQVFTHIIEELGELGSYFLYQERYKIAGAGHKESKEDVSHEFAQVFILFLQLAIKAGIDLEEAWNVEYKIMQNRFNKKTWEELAKD